MNLPKIIHLCWFSGEEFPEGIKGCIDSWRKNYPEYEIKIWDKKMTLSLNIPFATEAISVKKWAFAADVVRCYALYSEGGIYFDSDILVLKNFENLIDGHSLALFNESHLYAYEDSAKQHIEPKEYMGIQAACMMSLPGHPLMKKFLDYYKERHFIKWNGSYSYVISPAVFAGIAEKEGYVYEDKMQIIKDIIVYPSSYVAASSKAPVDDNCVAVHMCAHTWARKTTNVVNRVVCFLKAMVNRGIKRNNA